MHQRGEVFEEMVTEKCCIPLTRAVQIYILKLDTRKRALLLEECMTRRLKIPGNARADTGELRSSPQPYAQAEPSTPVMKPCNKKLRYVTSSELHDKSNEVLPRTSLRSSVMQNIVSFKLQQLQENRECSGESMHNVMTKIHHMNIFIFQCVDEQLRLK